MKSWITDWQRSERLPHYTRANAGETLPEPASPLGWTLVWGPSLTFRSTSLVGLPMVKVPGGMKAMFVGGLCTSVRK